MASLYGSDVVLSKARNGQVIRVISCGEGEVRTHARVLGGIMGLSMRLSFHAMSSRGTHANVEAGGALSTTVAPLVNRFARLIIRNGHWVRGLDLPFLTYLIYVHTAVLFPLSFLYLFESTHSPAGTD